MMNIKKSQFGFALVEQIIVLTIVSLLAISAIVTFTDVTVGQKQKTAIEDLYFNIRKIQNYALTGRLTDDGLLADSYGIYIKDNRSYIIFLDVDNDKIFSTEDSIIQEQQIPLGLSISPVKATITSAVPQGTFCFDADNFPDDTVCDLETVISIRIDNTETYKAIRINHFLGYISYEE